MKNRNLKILRGYKILKNKNELGKCNIVKREFSLTPCIERGKYYSLFFGKETETAELIIRQFLLARVENIFFSKEILYSVGNNNSKISCALPRIWIKLIRKEGLRVNKGLSALKFYFYVAKMFLSGILYFFKTLSQSKINSQHGKMTKTFCYLENLSKRNFPFSEWSDKTSNIFTDYLRWDIENLEVDTLCHNVKGVKNVTFRNKNIQYVNSAQVVLGSPKTIAQFLFIGFCMILVAFIDFFRGRWWHPLLLKESIKRMQMQIHESENLAKEYLFHNSNWIYRPLWTYEAERRGSRIMFYFYSTNVEGFKQAGVYPPPYFGWETATWSNYIVWDEEQKRFLRSFIKNVNKIFVVGPVQFESSQSELPLLPSDFIAVFDVQPVRDGFYNMLGITFDYYIPYNCNQFLLDIQEKLEVKKIGMVLKRKRDIGKLTHYKYRNLLKVLESKSNFLSITTDITAQQLIVNSKAVISMPFTATAIIARAMGKPSAYYDPLGYIQKDDRAAHGIKIITGKEELSNWISEVISV